MARASRISYQLLFVILGLTLARDSAKADTPELFVEDRVGGMTLQGTNLYWYADCGDDFSSRTKLRSKPTQGPVGPSTELNLYSPSTCQPDRIATNVAIDETNVYWVAGDGRVMTLPANGDGSVAPRELMRTGLTSVGGTGNSSSIAVDGTYLYWNERNRLMRAPKTGGGAASTIYSSDGIRLIRAVGDGNLYFIRGTQLVFLQSIGGLFFPRYLDSNVKDYALDNLSVYWAAARPGAPAYVRSQLHGATSSTVVYTADSRTPDIDALAVDSTSIYVHTRQPAGSGPIFRLPLSGGTVTAITSYLSIAPRLLSDGQYLFWTDYNTGIYRLRVNAAPIARPNGNIWITGLEVTQGIQVPENLVPLVGFKPTVVRVYVRSQEDSNGPWNNVRAQLSVRGSSETHGSPVITVPPGGSNPRSRDDSFTFLLNPADTAPGERSLTVRIFGPVGRPETRVADNTMTKRLAFGPPRSITIWGYTFGNRNNAADCMGGAPNDYVPPFSNFDVHRQYVENTYPVSAVTIVPLPGTGMTFDNTAYEDMPCGAARRAGDALMRIVSTMPEGSQRVNFMYPTQGSWGWCCNQDRGHSVVHSEDERTDPGITLSHEMAHSYGGIFFNAHTFDRAFGYPRTNYTASSDDDGPLGPWVGVELFPTSRLIPGLAPDGRPAAWDFMSYHPPGQPFWVSPYTYCKLLNYLSNGEVLCPNTVEGGGMERSFFTPERSTEIGRSETFRAHHAHAIGNELSDLSRLKQTASGNPVFLYVAGDVSPDGRVRLAPFETIDAIKDLTSKPLGKTYTLRFEDVEGKVLAEFPFDVSPFNSSPPKGAKNSRIQARPFNFYVPWNSATARIAIFKDNIELAHRIVSRHTPKISTLTLVINKTPSGKQSLSWKALDEDGDQLTYSVWYSRDGGREWVPIAANLNVDNLRVDLDQLPGANAALFRVLASDGVNTSQLTMEKSFTVSPKPPQITISNLADGATLNGGQEYLLEASAFSYEHGAITDSNAFVWLDKGGRRLGVGPWIVLRLSLGEHVIKLNVTDPSGLTAAAYKRLVVQPTRSEIQRRP